MPEKVLEKIPTLIPIKRFLEPEEIAHAVKFLFENDGCSDFLFLVARNLVSTVNFRRL